MCCTRLPQYAEIDCIVQMLMYHEDGRCVVTQVPVTDFGTKVLML